MNSNVSCCVNFFRYPAYVKHLILADPWGFPHRPSCNNSGGRLQVPFWIRALVVVVQPFNPLAILRAAGPWGRCRHIVVSLLLLYSLYEIVCHVTFIKLSRVNKSTFFFPGPSLIKKIRPDFKNKFRDLDENDLYDYIYHCNAQTPR